MGLGWGWFMSYWQMTKNQRRMSVSPGDGADGWLCKGRDAHHPDRIVQLLHDSKLSHLTCSCYHVASIFWKYQEYVWHIVKGKVIMLGSKDINYMAKIEIWHENNFQLSRKFLIFFKASILPISLIIMYIRLRNSFDYRHFFLYH